MTRAGCAVIARRRSSRCRTGRARARSWPSVRSRIWTAACTAALSTRRTPSGCGAASGARPPRCCRPCSSGISAGFHGSLCERGFGPPLGVDTAPLGQGGVRERAVALLAGGGVAPRSQPEPRRRGDRWRHDRSDTSSTDPRAYHHHRAAHSARSRPRARRPAPEQLATRAATGVSAHHAVHTSSAQARQCRAMSSQAPRDRAWRGSANRAGSPTSAYPRHERVRRAARAASSTAAQHGGGPFSP